MTPLTHTQLFDLHSVFKSNNRPILRITPDHPILSPLVKRTTLEITSDIELVTTANNLLFSNGTERIDTHQDNLGRQRFYHAYICCPLTDLGPAPALDTIFFGFDVPSPSPANLLVPPKLQSSIVLCAIRPGNVPERSDEPPLTLNLLVNHDKKTATAKFTLPDPTPSHQAKIPLDVDVPPPSRHSHTP
jgi:hypothetical protein